MPDYFSFEERDSVDPVKMFAAINSKDYTDEKKEEPIKFKPKLRVQSRASSIAGTAEISSP